MEGKEDTHHGGDVHIPLAGERESSSAAPKDESSAEDEVPHKKVSASRTSAEIKIMNLTRPGLDRGDVTQRSVRAGTLKMQLETSTVLFGKVRQWKERFVFIDDTEGIFFCQDRESFEKHDKKHIKVLPFSDIAGVVLKKPEEDSTVEECRFVVYVKARAHAVFGPEIELESPAGMQDADEWVKALKQKILVKARVYTVGMNGEFPEHVRGVRPNVAICFSGGGGRAHICASSQLRALHHLGFLRKQNIDYMSGVSAGAWATCIYTFYRKGAANDDELLGELMSTDLKKWTLQALDTEAPSPLLRPALESCMKVASELVWRTPPHELWEAVMGSIFLQPFGLNKELPYALREEVDMIKRENPHLANVKFVVPRDENRPFWICHGTIIGPGWAKLGDLLPIQFTALYTGSPYLHKMHYQSGHETKRREEVVWVGGGMVDSFAFGGDEPTSIVGSSSKNLRATTSALGSFRSFLPKSTSTNGMLRLRSSRAPSKSPTNADATTGFPSSPSNASSRALTSNGQVPPLASQAFADLVTDQFQSKLKTRAVPQYANDINEAMATLNLGPQMVQRVFRHAQEALKSQNFYNKGDLKPAPEDDESQEGVLQKEVKLPYPGLPLSLRHTLGISSDAPSVNLHEKTTFKRLNVQERYWTPVFVNTHLVEDAAKSMEKELNMAQSIATTHAVTMDMGDGGSLDNLGVCGMLQRGVRKLMVFCNTNNLLPNPFAPKPQPKEGVVKWEFEASRRLSVGSRRPSDPGEQPPTPNRRASLRMSTRAQSPPSLLPLVNPEATFQQLPSNEPPPTFEEWADDDILPLFGQSVDEKMLNYLGTHHSHNHVFPLTELRPLLRKMQEKLVKGEPVVVRMQHDVLDNPFWGIMGGWKVDILWVYLDDSMKFRSSLPDDTIQELDKGKGEFARFPNFKTFGNNSNFSFDIALTLRQINLLSVYTEWQLMYHKDLIAEFMNEELPPIERKRKPVKTCLDQLAKEGFC